MMIRNNIFKILIGFLFLFLTWLLLFNYGHCASDQDYFPMYQNKNGLFNETVINFLNTQYDSENNFIFCRTYGTLSGNRPAFTVTYFSKAQNSPRVYAEKNNNLYQFSLYKYGNGNLYQKYFYYNNGTCTEYTWTQSNWATDFSNLYSSNYRDTVDYISNFNLLTNNTDSAQLVLIFQTVPEYDDPDNDTYPNNVDKPDIEDFIPENEPTFDNTDTMSGLTSIFNFLTWLGDLIKGLFNYVVNALNWGLQKVINSVRNAITGLLSGIQTAISNAVTSINGFLSDIKDKVDDITDKLTDFADLFIHPFDEEEYEDQIANCKLISQYNQLIDNCEDIQAIFDNAEERDHFSLYIDFENPFADSQHRIIASEINFDWLVPLRSVYRPFLWVFALVDLFTGSMRLLGGIIGGKAK